MQLYPDFTLSRSPCRLLRDGDILKTTRRLHHYCPDHDRFLLSALLTGISEPADHFQYPGFMNFHAGTVPYSPDISRTFSRPVHDETTPDDLLQQGFFSDCDMKRFPSARHGDSYSKL
ncbi:hypothetical protein K6L44_09060 [Gluconacetobacter entanii]|uniref:hypothetical protein n=1 Tax=Gluconacetobacter entanii TaxID=108528 RepID=UPI001C935B2C|nr:hypothetical protein [Gluconacetobacter entanii]MBY4640131.1 hypothetical protein [Gluconacetobacter entanii]MCW4580481.1 hypothetical protein [Gluconacetobacter entanii]MCW4583785.1 hypothetical protein [Gluconacetobacter entanii]